MPSEQKIIVIPDGKICDYIDGKFRNDTPEEYVRQTIEKRLVNEHKYLPEQIRIEYTLQVGSNKPRADIVIWEEGADQTQGTIKLIIECKKETVDARNAKDGIAQLKSYMSVCPNCEWGMWTNSVQKYVFRKAVDAAGNITFMEYNDIPAADGNLDEVNRPSRTSLPDFLQCKHHRVLGQRYPPSYQWRGQYGLHRGPCGVSEPLLQRDPAEPKRRGHRFAANVWHRLRGHPAAGLRRRGPFHYPSKLRRDVSCHCQPFPQSSLL